MMVMGACRVDDRFGLWFVVVVAEEFKSYFAGFGSVLEHQIMQDHSTGRSRGFGFVTFDSEQTVEDILAHGKMHELGGKQVSSGGRPEDSCRVQSVGPSWRLRTSFE
jgi:hypothetical protein